MEVIRIVYTVHHYENYINEL